MPLDLERWTASIFDHPGEGPVWYHDPRHPLRDPEPARCVELLSGLFAAPARQLARYSDAQLARGLWYLVDNGCSSYALALLDAGADLRARVDCIERIPTLFAEVFGARCAPRLSHGETVEANPLNTTCYMWWDLFPSWGAPPRNVDAALLAAMTATLEVDSLACREAALHGLGHWQAAYPERVDEVIERFLRRDPLPDALRRYAMSARQGCIQ